MKYRFGTLIVLATILTSCGGTPADKELELIHSAYKKQLEQHALATETPAVAETKTNIHLTTSPDESLFAGSTDITIASVITRDVRQERNPLLDALLSVHAKLTAPNGTFGQPSTGKNPPDEKAELQAELHLRTAERTALVSLSGLALTAPTFMPTPFSLPPEMMTRWYGITFDDLNASMAESSKANGKTPEKIEDLISRTFHSRQMSKQTLVDIFDNLHLWNGIEILTGKEDQNLIQIRVESDKRKIQASVRSFVQAIAKMSGNSWNEQVQNNVELQQALKELQSDNPEFLRDMGMVKGILTADAKTHLVVGFSGEIEDTKGGVTAKVDYAKKGEDGFSAILSDTQSGGLLTVKKEGKNVSVSFDDTKEDGDAITLLTFTISDMTKETLRISNLHFQAAQENIRIDAPSLSVTLSNASKDMTTSAVVKGTRAGKEIFTFSFDSIRKELPSVSIGKPSYSPLETLQADVMQALMGSAQ